MKLLFLVDLKNSKRKRQVKGKTWFGYEVQIDVCRWRTISAATDFSLTILFSYPKQKKIQLKIKKKSALDSLQFA